MFVIKNIYFIFCKKIFILIKNKYEGRLEKSSGPPLFHPCVQSLPFHHQSPVGCFGIF